MWWFAGGFIVVLIALAVMVDWDVRETVTAVAGEQRDLGDRSAGHAAAVDGEPVGAAGEDMAVERPPTTMAGGWRATAASRSPGRPPKSLTATGP
jgi:hypothetical protein